MPDIKKLQKTYKRGMRELKTKFISEFPNADLKKFDFEVDLNPSGDIAEKKVYYKIDDVTSYDIESDTFWRHKEWVHHLGLSDDELSMYKVWGDKFRSVSRLIKATRDGMVDEFKLKHPNVNTSKFEFEVLLDKDGTTVTEKNIYYKVTKNSRIDIKSDRFKKHYTYELDASLSWEPKIWSTNGTVTKPNPWHFHRLPFNILKFMIHVNEDQGFTTDFTPLDTTWRNTTKTKNIGRVKFDTSDPYFASLAAAYEISCRGGFSLEHITEKPDTPKIITSIARYCVYFHMTRLLRNPEKVILTDAELAMLHHKVPWRTVEKDGWVMSLARNKDDWMSYFRKTSTGLTKKGVMLLQQAIESYVFSVLGAQARTRWPIVGGGAKSIQTQQVFKTIVEATIAEDDITKNIENMRQSILDTNVVLNLVITPGVILIPSDMIIIKKKVPGWNNVLTLATVDMKFGVNPDVNTVTHTHVVTHTTPVVHKHVVTHTTPTTQTTPVVHSHTTPVVHSQKTSVTRFTHTNDYGFVEYAVGGVAIATLTRYLISYVL